MSKESSNDQPGKTPNSTAVPSAESTEAQDALARFTSLLDKMVVTPAKDEEGASDKPAD
jgi:hypothetical protein